MSVGRYPEYRASGIEWLPIMPAHWRLSRVKHEVSFTTGWTPSTDDAASFVGDNLWANISDLGPRVLCDTGKRVSDLAVRSAGAAVSPAGSLLFSFKLSIGQVSFAGCDMYTNEAIATFLPSGSMLLSYAYYALPLYVVHNAADNIYGAKLLNQQLIRDAHVLVPPIEEQRVIAAFLDEETAKLDALVAEQQRLIALLREKRQAAIDTTVRTGLTTGGRTRSSGLQWLGTIPEAWSMRRLKHVSPAITVGIVVNPSEYVAAEGLPFLYGGDVGEGVVHWQTARRISPDDSLRNEKTRLREGDLVCVRVGAPGVTAVVPPECDGGNCASVMLVRRGESDSRWLCYVMNSRVVRYQVELVQYGAAQEQFNISHAVNFWIPVPPRSEQEEIAASLDRWSQQADTLIADAERAIVLLQERRTALISAAVTGQIDVRAYRPAEEPVAA